MSVPIAVTERTNENFLFDAGLVVRNYDKTKTLAAQEENWIGATSGGCSFTAKPNIIAPKIDGIPDTSPVKGAERIAGWEASIKANHCEISRNLLIDLLPGSSYSVEDGYDSITPGQMDASDYVGNIAVVVTHSSAGAGAAPEGAVFILYNARGSDTGVSLDFKPNENSVLPAEFVACYDGENMDDPIWEILMPQATDAVSYISA